VGGGWGGGWMGGGGGGGGRGGVFYSVERGHGKNTKLKLPNNTGGEGACDQQVRLGSLFASAERMEDMVKNTETQLPNNTTGGGGLGGLPRNVGVFSS